MIIRLAKASFYNEKETQRRLARFVARAKIFSMGEQCARFEEEFAKKQGRTHAIFVGSGSSANLILIQALLNLGRLKKGGKVGVSALTWATNVMPVIQLGLIPVPLDCELSTLNVSPRTLSERIEGLSAVFLTNVLGFTDDIRAIRVMCARKGVILIEDNCESLGSVIGGVRTGNFGLAATFSFFVGHHLSTIEGGMVVTDDRELADMLRMVRAHGWDRQLHKDRQKALRKKHRIDEHYGKYTFYELGYNVRPTEIQGFLGLEAMRYWDEIVAARERNFKTFHAASLENESIIPLSVSHMDTVSNFAFPVVFRDEVSGRRHRRAFEAAGVETRPVISGDTTLHPFWKKHADRAPKNKHSLIVHRRGFYFANNADLSKKEVAFLASLLEQG